MADGVTVTARVDRDDRALIQLAGMAALAIGIAYVVITGLYVVLGGAVPEEVATRLDFMAANTPVWWAIVALSVVTDLLFLPVALGLYVAFRGLDRNAMLVGSGLLGLFVLLDLAVTWPNYAALLGLSADYADATEATQRAAVTAAASVPAAVLDSGLFAVYAILVPALGILVMSAAMFRANAGRGVAVTGIATGILGTIAVVGGFVIDAIGALAILTSILTTVWVVLVGVGFLRGH